LHKPKAIAIIPARGGSKRIPRKNIKLFHSKPLIAYSIQTALSSGVFEKVIVSTDDEEIAEVAREYGAQVPFMRSKELSDDFATTGDVVADVIQKLKAQGEEFDYVCTIYATAPLLQKEYLQEAFEKLQNSDAKVAFSATSMPFPIQRTFKLTKDGRCEMFWPEHFRTRSQDLEEAYQDAGQFYWEKVGEPRNDILFSHDAIPIILPRHLVQDIDTLEDWERAEILFNLLHKDRFDEWNTLKKKLHQKEEVIHFKEGEVYFLSVGKNIGYEVYGKAELFLRPVLVYKKLTKQTFLGIPLTSQTKEGSFYFSFNYKQGKTSTAMFHQIRVFDIKRSEYYSGKISKNTMKNLKIALKEFMKFTSSEEEDRPTRAK